MTIERARRNELGRLPDWARIGARWEIGVGEPVFVDPGEHQLSWADDTLVRVLFGTFEASLSDGSHGLDAGWVLVVKGGARLSLRVHTRTQLRLFARPRVEDAHRLWRAYRRILSQGSPPAASSDRGAFLDDVGLAGLARWIPDGGAVLLRNGQGSLSQTLAALPREALALVELQRPYEGPSCPEAMAFYEGADVHLGVIEALAAAGVTIRDEELFVRRGGTTTRWIPSIGAAGAALLEALADLVPDAAPAARNALRSREMLEPVLQALTAMSPALGPPWPLAVAGPVADDVAHAWAIGPVPLAAVLRSPPGYGGEYEVAPGAVDGRFRTCAIVLGPLSTPARLVVDVEWAADHELTVHRCGLERRDDGRIDVTDQRCIAQED